VSIVSFALKNKAVIYFAVFLLAAAGIASYFSLGQLEDPEFTVKTAVIATPYPGASPAEVELEVTDRIEIALQDMKQLDYLKSFSRAGLSLIEVNIKQEFWADQLPQVWDEMRRKIRDIETTLPPGAGRPIVSDDFGDVFGLLLAITGDGYTYAQLEKYAKDLRTELSLVQGVARVQLWGVRDPVVYLNVSETQLTNLGLSEQSIENALQHQNVVVDAGGVDVQNKRLRIAPTGEFRSPSDIADLALRPSITDRLQDRATQTQPTDGDELIRIRDIGTVSRGYGDPARTMMRFNGQPALAIAVTNVSGANVVAVGRAVERRLAELVRDLPAGVEVLRVHWQSNYISEAVKDFFTKLWQAVLLVLIVVTVVLGWRIALMIGSSLVLTILGTFVVMAAWGIDLQRMSLGALIVVLGEIVDNSIVVAEGTAMRIKKGMERKQAVLEGAALSAWPLLGATVVAIMAFYPIFASTANAGEYCRTLFIVVAISLFLSWLLAMTLTPLQCFDMLPVPKESGAAGDPYAGGIYRRYKALLESVVRYRWFTIASMVTLLIVAVLGFGKVERLFFPDSSMPKFMIDYWAPEGTRIQQVAADLKRLEQKLMSDKRVESVNTFIGAGPPRFYLPVSPEAPNPSYAQLIVNMHSFRDVDGLIADLQPWITENIREALVPIRKYGVGPSHTWSFEARFSGPALADPSVLRSLADQGTAILHASPLAGPIQTDWRQRVPKVELEYGLERARWAGVTRGDIAKATKRSFDGRVVGTYRERDDLIPIVLRNVEAERANITGMDVLQVQPGFSSQTVPLSQVTGQLRTEWEDPLIWRRDRRRTITVQANPISGVTLPTLRESVLAKFDAIKLPPGYRLEWGGEYEDTVQAQASLLPGVIPMVAVMLLTIVALFNALGPLFTILLALPFAAIGPSLGLLVFGVPFGFLALLGAMGVAGMMVKNSIVLLEEVHHNLAHGKSPYDSLIDGAVSRMTPVLLAAGMTVVGVLPLLKDVFWVGLAATLISGLAFGAVVTLVIVPVIYATLSKIKS
jgi:multidrug efflux pump subunit AcrB